MLYSNTTRVAAIVTIQAVDPGCEQDLLKVRIPSAMKSKPVAAGIYDVWVGAGENIALSGNIVVEFLGARNAE